MLPESSSTLHMFNPRNSFTTVGYLGIQCSEFLQRLRSVLDATSSWMLPESSSTLPMSDPRNIFTTVGFLDIQCSDFLQPPWPVHISYSQPFSPTTDLFQALIRFSWILDPMCVLAWLACSVSIAAHDSDIFHHHDFNEHLC